MASQGPNSPGTAANVSDGEILDWFNPDNAKTSNDTYATVEGDGSLLCNFLQLTNFGFSIPGGATIDGIVVEIERKSDFATVQDVKLRLVKAGVISGDNKAVAFLPVAEAYRTYGGAADLWGLALSATDINASNFGVAYSVAFAPDADTAYVDHVRITVYYTAAAGGLPKKSVIVSQAIRRASTW